MTLAEYIEKDGYGSITRIMRDSGCAYMTVWRAVRGLGAVRLATAKAISQATRGEVSIAELCDPEGAGSRPNDAA